MRTGTQSRDAAAMTFAQAVAAVRAARTFADLAGGGDPAAAYRRISKLVHPDVAPPGAGRTATDAFADLGRLWAARDTERHTGDLADLSEVDGGLLKMPRSPADNDLMAAETEALTRLWRDGDPRFRPYAPRLLDTYTHEDQHGVRRTVNVVQRRPGFEPVRPGLDAAEAVWVLRRLLVALGWAHRAGVVHGAVFAEHVLVNRAEGGLMLIDWCYSVAPGGVVAATPARYRSAVPAEITGKRPAGPATDIHLAAGLIDRLIAKPVPAAVRRFLAGCRYDAPRMRPQDAWKLLDEIEGN
jgi:hypothetical protein